MKDGDFHGLNRRAFDLLACSIRGDALSTIRRINSTYGSPTSVARIGRSFHLGQPHAISRHRFVNTVQKLGKVQKVGKSDSPLFAAKTVFTILRLA
ncbi:MAG: hypothetical protein HC869_20525 [Rhodospirillales bacterium]|nr:hypothetical protein [Rhodospirillales bacterium]